MTCQWLNAIAGRNEALMADGRRWHWGRESGKSLGQEYSLVFCFVE